MGKQEGNRKDLLREVLKDFALALLVTTLAVAGLSYILWRTCPIQEG
jgi:hypothetical protein